MSDQPEFVDIPSVQDYKRALVAIEPIADSRLELLKFHYRCPQRTATASELAEAVGYQNWRATNLQYGTLADDLCKVLDRWPETRLDLLATFTKPEEGTAEHWKIHMRPEVAQAISELGWV